MNEHQSLELPLDYRGLEAFSIREDGTVRTPKGTLLTPLTMAHAAREIASKDPFGLGVHRATTGTDRDERRQGGREDDGDLRRGSRLAGRDEAVEEGHPSPGIAGRRRTSLSKPRVVEFMPDDEIRCPAIRNKAGPGSNSGPGTVWFFHGPSTAARLLQAAAGGPRINDKHSTERRGFDS